MHANLTHLFVFFFCMIVCQLVKYLFLRSLKRTVLPSWGIFFRESSEHLSETKDAEPFLLRLIWLSSLLEPSHLLLSSSNLHNQITHLILSSVVLDFLLSPHCCICLTNFLYTYQICKDLFYHLHFPSSYTPSRISSSHYFCGNICSYLILLLSTHLNSKVEVVCPPGGMDKE